jgi:hypothetical protein
MLIGYARDSTNEQETATQAAVLKAPDVSGFIARRRPGDGGTDVNFTGCSSYGGTAAKAGFRSLTEAIVLLAWNDAPADAARS